jgi:hypothetical protein
VARACRARSPNRPGTPDAGADELEDDARHVWHIVWAFAVAALKLHLDNSKIELPPPAGGHENFRAALAWYVDVLANREADSRSSR